ncbi:MAG TPA: metal ABC transporter permease [Alphaproteobacteria bacterium]|nr:metal ABC transporter permease [Alphaproteobacteria bacterium]
MDDFVIRALAAGIAVALVAGPIGCFVVWRHMAFFGATIAHSALLGIGLGIILGIHVMVGLFAVGAVVALILVTAEGQRWLATDTLLSILAHTALAAGIVVLAFLEGVRVDLMGYLFGDILAVGPRDLWIIAGTAGTALATLCVLWRPLLNVTLDPDVAAIEGVRVLPTRICFMLLLALIVAVSLKVIGILLITALLVIPAATARKFSHTPEFMAVMAAVLGCIAVGLGMGGSAQWDLPTGPAIVVAAAGLFLLGLAVPAGVALSRR